ncbi:MAG TPA: tetratricopeptide repeat protein, partial [Acidimicrobiales bacterium]|nr:tetratricopeptide repeat protein [Acidimicrobiales bacterium]
MADRLIVDLADDHTAVVSAQPGTHRQRRTVGEPVAWVWPLEPDEDEDLRWYLESSPRSRSGTDPRGVDVAARLGGWGHALFGALFGAGPARRAYDQALGSPDGAEVVIRSSSPDMLALPWELLHDPARSSPMALDLLGLTRGIPSILDRGPLSVPGTSLRILMVICRPDDLGDDDYTTLSRPLMARLGAVRGPVELVVLRPPTLDALVDTLAGADDEGRPFHVVHFEGQGALLNRTARGRTRKDGVWLLEARDGGPNPVSAGKLGETLRSYAVPLVVLSASHPHVGGTSAEAAMATTLLRQGLAAVLTTGYCLDTGPASDYLGAVYDRLFAGDDLAQAASAGRHRLIDLDGGTDPTDAARRADWIVPVLYRARDVAFPELRVRRRRPASGEGLHPRARPAVHVAGEDALDAVDGSFVGRDGLLWDMEAAARSQRVVVLHGPGGAGKTELAKAFGRWWRDTRGVEEPHWVHVHSFEPGVAAVGLDGAVNALGVQLFGTDFVRVEQAQRHALVGAALRDHRMLLIWDNFESVRSSPDDATPGLDDEAWEQLRRFVAEIATGPRSALVITSRSEEPALGAVRRIPVAGLARRDAATYADRLVEDHPVAEQRRHRPSFSSLMAWLDGHPLSMRVVLPLLQHTEPDALVARLPDTGADTGADPAPRPGGEVSTSLLETSVGWALDQLDAALCARLVVACLFRDVVEADVLGVFSGIPGVPERFANVTRRQWKDVLDRAVDAGLLTEVGGEAYGMHPAVPGLLAKRWRKEAAESYEGDRAASLDGLLEAHAILAGYLHDQLQSDGAPTAVARLARGRRTFGALLAHALDTARWEEGQQILQPLSVLWSLKGLDEEARGWLDRARSAVEELEGRASDLDTDAGALWLFATGHQGTTLVVAGRLAEAAAVYLDLAARLEAQPGSVRRNGRLVSVYGELGAVAHLQGRLDDAETWHRKALRIEESRHNPRGVAGSYHQLGIVAELRGRLDEAEGWHRKALGIQDSLDDRPGLAATYHQLGMVAQAQMKLDEAEDWYRKALDIEVSLGDGPK